MSVTYEQMTPYARLRDTLPDVYGRRLCVTGVGTQLCKLTDLVCATDSTEDTAGVEMQWRQSSRFSQLEIIYHVVEQMVPVAWGCHQMVLYFPLEQTVIFYL